MIQECVPAADNLTEENCDQFYRDIGRAIFSAVSSANNLGHKRPLHTIKTYLMKSDSLASEFIYDLFHSASSDGGSGLTEDLFKKWMLEKWTIKSGE